MPVDRKNVKQPPLLFDRTQAIVAKIERQIGRKLMAVDAERAPKRIWRPDWTKLIRRKKDKS